MELVASSRVRARPAREIGRKRGTTCIAQVMVRRTSSRGGRRGSNDVILLEDMVERSRLETLGLLPAEQEAYFVSKHYLRQYRPSHDDLLASIVDGSNDGGIDGI